MTNSRPRQKMNVRFEPHFARWPCSNRMTTKPPEAANRDFHAIIFVADPYLPATVLLQNPRRTDQVDSTDG